MYLTSFSFFPFSLFLPVLSLMTGLLQSFFPNWFPPMFTLSNSPSFHARLIALRHYFELKKNHSIDRYLLNSYYVPDSKSFNWHFKVWTSSPHLLYSSPLTQPDWYSHCLLSMPYTFTCLKFCFRMSFCLESILLSFSH